MIEVLKQMVEALEWCHGGEPVGTAEAIQAGKKLIAEWESQEPVAQPASEEDMKIYRAIADNYRKELTHPPQRKPLTDDAILNVARDHYNSHQRPEISFARAIEAAHGIKEES